MILPEGDFGAAFQRGMWDIEFFSSRFLGVNLHPGQVRFARTVMARDDSNWRAKYLTIALSSGNRAGKTLALAIVILHSCIYKLGVRPPADQNRDLVRWSKAEYVWFHFGIAQEIAELVFWEMVKLASGTHEAQRTEGCPLSKDLPEWASWDKKYQGEYRLFVIHPLLGGAQIHFRTTGERALGSLGRDMHGISFDECAFEPHLDFVVNEVLTLRRLGTGGQLILVSTPTEGITLFADLWEKGNPKAPDRSPDRMSVRMSTRDNVGFGIDRVMFDRLVADLPPELVPQNIDGYFIEGRFNYFSAAKIDAVFVEGLPEMQPALHRHAYAQGVDAALTYDESWSIVLDCTNRERVVGVKVSKLKGGKTTEAIVALVSDSHFAYTVKQPNLRSSCSTAIDATGFGGKMFREALGGISPLRNIEFGGSKQKKLKLLGDLKTAIDLGHLVLPRVGLWLTVRRQLAGYKLADRAIEQDAVMALVCAWAEVQRSAGVSSGPVRFNPFAPDEDSVPLTHWWEPEH